MCVGGGAQRSGYTSFIVRGDVLSFCVTSWNFTKTRFWSRNHTERLSVCLLGALQKCQLGLRMKWTLNKFLIKHKVFSQKQKQNTCKLIMNTWPRDVWPHCLYSVFGLGRGMRQERMQRARKELVQTSRVSLMNRCVRIEACVYRSTRGLHVATNCPCFHFVKISFCVRRQKIEYNLIITFSFFKQNSLIQPVLHYTDTWPFCDLALVHHIQIWWGLIRWLNYISCIHCATEHLGGGSLLSAVGHIWRWVSGVLRWLHCASCL